MQMIVNSCAISGYGSGESGTGMHSVSVLHHYYLTNMGKGVYEAGRNLGQAAS